MKFIVEFIKSSVFTLFTIIVLLVAIFAFYFLKENGYSTTSCWFGALSVVGLAGVAYVFFPRKNV